MPWHAFTLDGLDSTLADTEFAQQAGDPVSPSPPVVNDAAVGRFMNAVQPHLQKAISAGFSQAVTDWHKDNRQAITLVTIGAGTFAIVSLALLYSVVSRLRECCPAKSVGGCCG